MYRDFWRKVKLIIETQIRLFILLKLSGEALAGDKHHGFDEPTVTVVAKQVKLPGRCRGTTGWYCHSRRQLGEDVPVRRSTASKCRSDRYACYGYELHLCVRNFSSVGMMTSCVYPVWVRTDAAESYIYDRANKYFAHNMVVLLAGEKWTSIFLNWYGNGTQW